MPRHAVHLVLVAVERRARLRVRALHAANLAPRPPLEPVPEGVPVPARPSTSSSFPLESAVSQGRREEPDAVVPAPSAMSPHLPHDTDSAGRSWPHGNLASISSRSVWRESSTRQIAMVRSSEHVAKRRLLVPPDPPGPPCSKLGSGSNDAHHTVLVCPPSSFVSVCAHDQSSPPGSSVQTLIESSYDVDTSASSAGCHTTCLTSWVWPLSTATHSKSCPGWTSQIHTLLSRPHVARSEPDGDHAHDLTSFSWPSTTATHSHSFVDPLWAHTAVLASKEAVARSRPVVWMGVDGWMCVSRGCVVAMDGGNPVGSLTK